MFNEKELLFIYETLDKVSLSGSQLKALGASVQLKIEKLSEQIRVMRAEKAKADVNNASGENGVQENQETPENPTEEPKELEKN